MTGRDDLERAANRTRERLLDTLSALDHRRHEVQDHPVELLEAEMHEHMTPIAITTGALILGISSAIGWSVYRLATRDQRRREERWNALRRFWNHPERLARSSPPEGSLASQLGRKVLLSAIGWASVELTKRSLLPLIRSRAYGTLAPPRVLVRTLPA